MTFHTKLLWVKKPLRIRFDKMSGFIAIYGGNEFNEIYDKIKYLINEKVVLQIC